MIESWRREWRSGEFPFLWVQLANFMAPDAELAIHYARELYGRRQESVRLWVVRRGDILDLDDPDLLQPPLDRSFKKPGGYVMRDKLAAAREQSGQAKPKARSK